MTEHDPSAGYVKAASTDAELAIWERECEQNPDGSRSNDTSSHLASHARLYHQIDHALQPFRAAVRREESAPNLPDYDELEEIGRGGMGVVYRARHRKTQRVEAIKIIRPDRLALASPSLIRQLECQFRVESQLAARIAHEHIVPIYQIGEIDGSPWYSMQWVDGESLRERLQRPGSLTLEEAVVLMKRVARAIHVVHQHGVLHGDIKPHNILIERETGRPLIADFGLAEFLTRRDSFSIKGIAGTPAYMAPELAKAAKEGASPEDLAAVRTVASDVYSLGMTLWSAIERDADVISGMPELMKPQLSVAAERTEAIVDNSNAVLPSELRNICRCCLSSDPDQRFATAGKFADALEHWLDRPKWNENFPRLRHLLWALLAPALLVSGLLVTWLIRQNASEMWIWMAMLSGYVPLFFCLAASHGSNRPEDRARRELWSVWLGHMVGTVSCLFAIRILCGPDSTRVAEFFYPCWAAISASTFAAKSANFWQTYQWFALAWAVLAVILAITPQYAPILFATSAALTSVLIARGDRSFHV